MSVGLSRDWHTLIIKEIVFTDVVSGSRQRPYLYLSCMRRLCRRRLFQLTIGFDDEDLMPISN